MAWIQGHAVSTMLTVGMGHFRKQPVSSGARNLHFTSFISRAFLLGPMRLKITFSLAFFGVLNPIVP
jgi:hypothetical protein